MFVEEGIPRARRWKSVTDDAVCGAVQGCVKREKPEGLREGKPRKEPQVPGKRPVTGRRGRYAKVYGAV